MLKIWLNDGELWCVFLVHQCFNRRDIFDSRKALEWCNSMHYINIRGQPYEQVDGAAMGSPVSTVVVNMYKEFF